MSLKQKWTPGVVLFVLFLSFVLFWPGLPQIPERAEPVLSAAPDKPLDLNSGCIAGPDRLEYLDQSGEIAVLSWNIHKQGDGHWPEALWSFGSNRQLLLLQEVGQTQAFTSAMGQAGFEYANLAAFHHRGVDYGVMTAASAAAFQVCGYLATEPWIRIPKGALASHFHLSNGQTLLVINLHGINFSLSLADWEAQLAPLFRDINAHQGPVIMAGDFNSWGEDRSKKLKQLIELHGLLAAKLMPDHRIRAFGTPLDWLFYRGLEMKKAQSPTTELSDHTPLLAEFVIPGSASDGGIPDAHR